VEAGTEASCADDSTADDSAYEMVLQLGQAARSQGDSEGHATLRCQYTSTNSLQTIYSPTDLQQYKEA